MNIAKQFGKGKTQPAQVGRINRTKVREPEPQPVRKKLSEFGEFDPSKPMKGPSRIVDITAQVLGSGVQIIGGVRPPTDKKAKTKKD